MKQRPRIYSPQLGLDPQSTLGGEIYDYKILKGLSDLGVKIDILLPKHRPYDKTVKNWYINFLPFTHIPAYLFNLLELPYLFATYRHRPFRILRLHTPYFTGIPWSHPWVFFMNWGALILLYVLWRVLKPANLRIGCKSTNNTKIFETISK